MVNRRGDRGQMWTCLKVAFILRTPLILSAIKSVFV